MSKTPLHVFTLALDAMPWIACIFAELNRLTDIRWHWTIVEGAAMNVKDTAWMRSQEPRLSRDGTTQFLDAIAHHPRVTVLRREKWNGKTEMCNAALATFTDTGVLMQQDSDELWTAEQYRTIVHLFDDDRLRMHARFHCRYFVGPNLVTTDEVDWWRAWVFIPGDKFSTHEPPVMAGNQGSGFTRQETKAIGLVFDHHSYTLPKQVEMKEQLYGAKYKGALTGWNRMQKAVDFPTRVQPFFPWSAPTTMVDRVY